MDATGLVGHEATSQRRWSSLWPVGYLAVASISVFLAFRQWGYDDPFITYRYADNLRAGLGFVYNPGERVLSTTTPLFALVLALVGAVWDDLPTLANLIGALSLSAGGLVLWDLGKSWRTPAVGWAGLLLYPTFPLLVSTLGSETPLYLALCLGAIAAYARKRYGWVAVLAAGAVLARPDGILVPALLVIHFLLRRRGDLPWRGILTFLAITGLWFAFAWAYFGSPLPATLLAKQHQGLMTISQRFAPGLIRVLQGYATAWPWGVEAVLIVLGLFGLVRWARPWLLLLAWSMAYFAAYSLLGVTSYFWYYAPLVPGAIVVCGLGLHTLARLLSRMSWSQVLAFAPAVLVVLLALAQAGALDQMRQAPDRRVAIYQDVGRWLSGNTPPGSTVGSLEVGIIGFYARRPMVDFAGLIQPEVARQLQKQTTYDDAALWATRHYLPNYLVVRDGSLPKLEEEAASGGCRPVQRFAGSAYGFGGDMSVYACYR
jgi:hypothetical protein